MSKRHSFLPALLLLAGCSRNLGEADVSCKIGGDDLDYRDVSVTQRNGVYEMASKDGWVEVAPVNSCVVTLKRKG